MKNKYQFILILIMLTFLGGCESEEPNPLIKSVTEGVVNLVVDGIVQKTSEQVKQANLASTEICQINCLDILETKPNQKVAVEFIENYDDDTASFMVRTDEGIESGQIVTVRFLLINSELKDKSTKKPQPLSEEAKQRTYELLTNAQTVYLETDRGDKYDKYNRLLAYVYSDDTLVQEVLVEEGLAEIDYVFEPNTTHLDRLKSAAKGETKYADNVN